MNKSSFEQNGGTYRMVGDYRIPNITLPAEANKPLGVWGMKRKDYLMKHKRVQFNIMLMNGTLWTYLAEVDEQAVDFSCFFIKVVSKEEPPGLFQGGSDLYQSHFLFITTKFILS